MIPTPEAVIAGYAVLSDRLALSPRTTPAAIRAALREAEHLAEDAFETPAALCFSFARNPRGFPGGWRAMTVLLAERQAQATGQKLSATRAEIADVARAVAARTMSYDDVKSWFLERLFPYAG